ncbi:MAG: MFS transporter [Janthinobacterium lividum]
MAGQGRFPALRSYNFRLLWLGQGISGIGSMMQVWAINWQLYALTHHPLALGLVGLFRVIPIILFSLIGGTVADTWDRRKVMLVTQTLLGSTAAALWLLTNTDHITPAWIYGLTVIASAALSFDNPARQSLIPQLVPRVDFASAIALNSIVFRTATIAGPMVAGLLIARGGLSDTYLINAASFLAVIGALLLMRPIIPDPSEVTAESKEPKGARAEVSWEALTEGLRFVWQTPILVWTLALDFLATFFSSANALLPIFARDILHAGARGYGVLAAAEAAGALIAGLIISVGRPIVRQGQTVIWAVVAYGLSTIVFGASHFFLLSWLALAAGGVADSISTILRQTIRQLVTPDRLRGRMTSVNMIFFMGGPQLGELEAGLAATWIGAPWAVITGGLGCLVTVAIVAARAPILRRYRSQ